MNNHSNMATGTFSVESLKKAMKMFDDMQNTPIEFTETEKEMAKRSEFSMWLYLQDNVPNRVIACCSMYVNMVPVSKDNADILQPWIDKYNGVS